MNQERRWLIESIRSQLLPVFAELGFAIVPLPEKGPRDREFVASFPFGRLRRNRTGAIDLAEIQLAPRGRAAFRINAGIAPAGGIESAVGHLDADDIVVGWLSKYYVLYASPLMRSWFSVSLWSGRTAAEADYAALALKVASLLPEIDRALRTGACGGHIKAVAINRPGA